MIRCTDGHFYDPEKHSSCPWCSKPIDLGGPAQPDTSAGKTVAVRAEPGGAAAPAFAAPAPAGPQVATKRLIREQLGVDPVVGWLVCLDGPDKGKDYRLHSEKNFIGRSPGMDVSVAGDETISRDKHATVTFEPKKQTFWLVPGDSTGLVYLNGEVLYMPAQIHERDVIELGKTRLTLVSFVNDAFRWE